MTDRDPREPFSRLDRLRDARLLGYGTIVGLLLAAGIWAYTSFKPSLPAVLGQTAAKVAGVETEAVACATAQVLPKKVEKKLGLPPAIQKDEQARVLAAVDVPRVDYPLIATSVLHLGTGIGEIYFTPQPLPWLAFNQRWTFGAFYGINDKESGVFLGTAQYEFLQLKRLHGAVHLQGDTSSRFFIGGGFTF